MRTALVGSPGERIYTSHAPLTMDPLLNRLSRRILGAYQRWLSRGVTRIIAVSQEELDHFHHQIGVAVEKLSLVSNGIDRSVSARSAKSHSDLPVCVGFLGRLAPQKNVAMLLAAFAQVLANTEQSPTLAIAGTGPLEITLRAEATRLGIDSQVRWFGECDASVLSTFDVFALPSWYEGLPYVLLEAMAAGLPIVATRVGGVGSLVSENLNGFTVPVNDRDGFALALRKLLDDSDLRRKLGAASAVRAESFTVQQMVAGVMEVYRASMCRGLAPSRKPLINVLKSSVESAD